MQVYADNAATTKLSKTALDAMMPYLTDIYGNASSLYKIGQEAHHGVQHARETVAKVLNADPSEVFFTSGGSEADNWAIKGVAEMMAKKGKKHIITSAFEHHAVLHTVQKLEKYGFEVTYLPVYENGIVHVEDVKNAIRDDTALVTIMYANNEIGTIQPIAEIGAVCREKGVLFHTDAVQAAGHVPIDVRAQNIDMLSMSAHKFHGPKGIGVLYIRSGVRLARLIAGGHQERHMRAGTTDTPLIVGMADALETACRDREKNNARITALRDSFIRRVTEGIPYVHLNGGTEHRLPNNVNFSFEFIEGESILINLDLAGIAVSSGSACSSGSLEPSHVILALGVPEELAHSSIRFSLGRDTTEEDMEYTYKVLKETVEKLRAISPLFNMEKGTGSYV